jgi:hypothetical protein
MNKTVFRTLRGVTLAAAIVAAAVVMVSCYPNGPESAEDFDVVATFYAQDTDFTSFASFAIVDSIAIVKIKGSENLDIDREYEQDILDAISENMVARGYTKEDNPDQTKPDFGVLVAAAATTEYDPYATQPWFNYWGDWVAFDNPELDDLNVSWGLDFSWYSGSVVYSYDVGAILVAIVDFKSIDPGTGTDDLTALWLGTMNGVATGNNRTMAERVLKGVDQMFAQSPYLSKTGGTQ